MLKSKIINLLYEELRIKCYWLLKKYFKYTDPVPQRPNPLTLLGRKYKTDKAKEHNYTETVYFRVFEKFKNEPIKLLELGVGDTGASVKMWRDFFPNGEIYVFDPFMFNTEEMKVTKEELESLNINVIKGNQLDRDDLKLLEPFGKFDFIIDDAAHLNDAQQITLASLFPLLKKGGKFFIEDLYCAKYRSKKLSDVNHFLNNDFIKKDFNKIYHQKDFAITHSLKHLKKTGNWKSLLLTNLEKKYLENNIDEFELKRNYNFADDLAIITKIK